MKLSVPICVHASFGSVTFGNLYPSVGKSPSSFPKFQLPVVAAFHELVLNEIPQKFPTLRFGFVETGAQWVPYVHNHLLRRPGFTHLTGPELMRQNRLYVACEVHEDLPYILKCAGEDSLVIGTDYGHADPHMEMNAVGALRARTDLEPRIVDKILDANARALYGL
jgi:predicted TIM-barrel fold metal-dependent hydrolase